MALAEDALVAHLRMDLAADWRTPPSWLGALLALPRAPWHDASRHEAFARSVDEPAHGDDRARTERYLRALAEVRDGADAGRPLDWGWASQVQAVVLGRPAGFRRGEAFGRGGRHRYAWAEGLEARFARKLECDGGAELPPEVKAARVYLDFAFVHPFEDGNGRAARLWFEHALRLGRARPPPVEQAVRLPKTAGSLATAWNLIALAAGAARGRHE